MFHNDTYPPFLINGNFGGAASINEMLIQIHQDATELLPALPDELSSGWIKVVRARIGIENNHLELAAQRENSWKFTV